MALTQCDYKTAQKFLKRNHWTINYALNDYYDTVIGDYVNACPNGKNNPQYPEELCLLYQKYATKDKCIIDSDGLIKLIEDLGYSLEDLVTICLAHLLNCSNISNGVTKDHFLLGCYNNGCSTLSQLRHILEDLDTKLEHDVSYFIQTYKYAFSLSVDPDKKELEIDTAIEYWKLFFQPKYPIHTDGKLLDLWTNFLKEENKSSISKDGWNMLIEFFRKYPTVIAVKQDYSEADPWPFIIDEFYEYLNDTGII